MDRHKSHHPSFSYQNYQSAYKREREVEGSERNHGDNKHFRLDHHRFSSGPAPWQNPPSSRGLSTRKDNYERDFPVYKMPVEVGCFSLDSERRFFNDSRQLRYYIKPDRSPNFDLKDGYGDRFVKRDDSVKEKLDHILHWILSNRSKVSSAVATASSR